MPFSILFFENSDIISHSRQERKREICICQISRYFRRGNFSAKLAFVNFRARQRCTGLLTRKDDRRIAKQLGIRQDTVNDHVSSILEKLNAANRTEAVSIAMRKHLLDN
jgi:DNA-binding CsgD family transcriptional regulator